MAQLHIIYAKHDGPLRFGSRGPGLSSAMLAVPDGLAGKDLYDVARRLAELLLEQIEGDE